MIQNREYEVEAGDLIYYGPNVLHTFRADLDYPEEAARLQNYIGMASAIQRQCLFLILLRVMDG